MQSTVVTCQFVFLFQNYIIPYLKLHMLYCLYSIDVNKQTFNPRVVRLISHLLVRVTFIKKKNFIFVATYTDAHKTSYNDHTFSDWFHYNVVGPITQLDTKLKRSQNFHLPTS